MDHTAFALTVAKIAYCYAIGEFGFGGFDGTEIRDLLVGRRVDVYDFVGSAVDGRDIRIQQLHRLSHYVEQDMLIVRVALFASCGANPILVVIGRRVASEEFNC